MMESDIRGISQAKTSYDRQLQDKIGREINVVSKEISKSKDTRNKQIVADLKDVLLRTFPFLKDSMYDEDMYRGGSDCVSFSFAVDLRTSQMDALYARLIELQTALETKRTELNKWESEALLACMNGDGVSEFVV